MSDATIDFVGESPEPPAEHAKIMEDDWIRLASKYGASKAYIEKRDGKWRWVAEFASSAEGAKRSTELTVFFERLTGRKAGFRAKEESSEEQMIGGEIASPDLLEGKILSAVLFDKHREPKLVLLNTSDGAAYDKGMEIKAPIVVFVGVEPAPQSKSDLWIAGMRFANGYGVPSERIREQLAQRAIKEVINTALVEGVKAFGMSAGQA